MVLTSHQKFALKKTVKELSTYRGRHTELVSVYVPEGYDMNKIISHIAQEQGTASNIKSTSTRKNVEDALERMVQHLKVVGRTPPNGLAAFSGNVAEREGQSDVRVWSLEPPMPLKIRIYRCDKLFVLDPLQEMVEDKECYGLVVLDRRDATLALLKGKTYQILRKTHSEVPGKMRAGGQCLLPDTEVTLENGSPTKIENLQVGDFIKGYDFEAKSIVNTEVGEVWETHKKSVITITTQNATITSSHDHTLFVLEKNTVKEKLAQDLTKEDILIAADFTPQTILSLERQENEIPLIDIATAHKNFIANGLIVHNSAERFARNRELAIKDHYKKISEYMKENFLGREHLKGIILGGPGVTVNDFLNKDYVTGDVKKKILGTKDLSYTDEFGINELIEKSEDLLAEEEIMQEKIIMNKFLECLARSPGKVSYGPKHVKEVLQMGVVDTLLLSESLDEAIIEEYEEEAKKYSTTVRIISTETREGVQLRDLGKIAAILRYEITQ